MKILQTSTLVIVTIILMVIIPLSFVLYSINQTVLKPYESDEYITKVELVEFLSDNIQGRFTDVDHPLKDEYEELFSSTLQGALDEVITQAWVNDKFNEMQVNVWDYLLDVTETVKPIHITELKEAIILEFELVLDEMGYPEEQAERFIAEMENQMPETLHIYDVLPVNGEQRSVQVKNSYQQSQQGYDVILLLTVILFVLGLFLTFYPKTLMRWSGYVLGVIGIFTFLIFSLLSKRNIAASTETVASTTMNEWGNGLSNLFAAIFRDIAQVVSPLALTLCIVGLLLVLFSHFPFIRRADIKIRDFSRQHPVWKWIRGVMAVFFFVAAGWQVYQLTLHANALW